MRVRSDAKQSICQKAGRSRSASSRSWECPKWTARSIAWVLKRRGRAEQPAIVLNQLIDVTRAAGAIGIPGLYVTEDPGAKDSAAKIGNLGLRFGLGWAKSHAFFTGQTPTMKYNRGLMMAILHGRIQIAKAVNVQVITLDQAPQGYKDFDKGAAKKFVIDPHGILKKAA
jgi:glutathione-independent formaldehyde dehydrogenase